MYHSQALLLLLLFTAFSEAMASGKEVMLHGEVDAPGAYSLNDHSELGSLLKKGGVTSLGATNRVRIYRSGVSDTYDLDDHKKFKLEANDIVLVPVKEFYEEQSTDQEHTSIFKAKNPLLAFKQIKKIAVDGVIVRHVSAHRVEFRSTVKGPAGARTRVLVTLESGNEAMEAAGPDRIVVRSRNWSTKIGPTPKLKYQQRLEDLIANICKG